MGDVTTHNLTLSVFLLDIVNCSIMAVVTSLDSLLEKLKVEDPYLTPRNWESLHSENGRFPPTRASTSSSSSVCVSLVPQRLFKAFHVW